MKLEKIKKFKTGFLGPIAAAPSHIINSRGSISLEKLKFYLDHQGLKKYIFYLLLTRK